MLPTYRLFEENSGVRFPGLLVNGDFQPQPMCFQAQTGLGEPKVDS
jgi:hypothetical protein